jgi:hypothetical protein
MKNRNIWDWLLPVIIFAIIFIFMNFWDAKTDREIEEYIRNNPQPTISEMK